MESILGPTYDYSAEIPTPKKVGAVLGDGSLDGIMGAAAAVDYYAGTVAFGESINEATARGYNQQPHGLRFFLDTGVKCSNKQNMYQYINTIPPGFSGHFGDEMVKFFTVNVRGLAPGIFHDAGKAMDVTPMFNTMMNSGLAKCRKVSLPVGDLNGNIQSPKTGKWWIDPSKEKLTYIGGKPHASHWIFDSWITQNQYDADQKAAGPVEGFLSGEKGSKILAGVLFAALFAGLVVFTSRK